MDGDELLLKSALLVLYIVFHQFCAVFTYCTYKIRRKPKYWFRVVFRHFTWKVASCETCSFCFQNIDEFLWAHSVTIAVYALAILRILLCLSPQNAWLSSDAQLSWGIYGNIPFAALGLIVILLFDCSAKEHNDTSFRFMWLTIVLSELSILYCHKVFHTDLIIECMIFLVFVSHKSRFFVLLLAFP